MRICVLRAHQFTMSVTQRCCVAQGWVSGPSAAGIAPALLLPAHLAFVCFCVCSAFIHMATEGHDNVHRLGFVETCSGHLGCRSVGPVADAGVPDPPEPTLFLL